MYNLDDTDVKILEALQADGRIPLTQLSTQLGIPHGTIRDRIRKMENAGVIERYVAVINPAKAGYLINCFVELTLDHRVDVSQAIDALIQIDEVSELHLLTGEVDVFVGIWARDIEHLRHILYDRFTTIPGMVRTNTLMVLNKQTKPVPLATQTENGNSLSAG
jgi:Lrp/AsnC family transcriptional regulator for asnA, asnC and gidA